METEGFGDLLQQAQQLTADMDNGGELPRVQRNLQQLMEAGQKLWSRTAQTMPDSSDVKASILLGSKGFDIPKISQKLESLSSAKTFEALEPVRDTDIQGFLRNERENALLAVIEQTRKNTFEDADRRHWESMENEWEREKQKILNALVGSAQDTVEFPSELEKSILSDSVSVPAGRSTMDNVEMTYSRQVYVYNEEVIQGGIRPSLGDMFSEVGRKIDNQNVSDIWEMIKYMTQVPVTIGRNPVESRSSQRLEKAFTDQAKAYLEASYVKYMTNTISGNLRQAQLGGIPGMYHLVKGFLNVRLPANTPGLEDGLCDGQPVWAMMYYCIRCGDLQAAVRVSQTAQHYSGDFHAYLQEYTKSADRRLSANSMTKIQLTYRRSVRNSTDPYKRAVFCIIGGCDSNNSHTEVAGSTEDYLWLKLCQLQFTETDDDDGTDLPTLKQLQTKLFEEYGESHFSANLQPFLYFKVLILTAQFEAAIEFLSRHDHLRCHAVHVALVLYDLKFLALPDNIQAPLLSKDSSDPEPFRRVNFARLVVMYTRKFEATDPREALQYFYFLRELKTLQGENLFISCVSELVLETREYEMLLGRLEKDGCRKPGVIDKFLGDTLKIIETVARDTEGKGRFEDAVGLYDLAKNHEKVMELLNKLLTQVLSQPSSPQSNRDLLKMLALSIAERYKSLGCEGTRSTTSTFYLLLDLVTFFDSFHTGNLDHAFDVIKQLKLLPFSVDAVEQKVNAFQHYNDEIRRSLPDILLATMNIISSKYRTARNQSPARNFATGDDGGKESFINYLRQQAKALITFSGRLPYRMPGDTHARLIQMEVIMN